MSSLEKSRQLVKTIRCQLESPIQVPEKPISFSNRTHDETLSVVAMRLQPRSWGHDDLELRFLPRQWDDRLIISAGE
jgi:hypothetical protein